DEGRATIDGIDVVADPQSVRARIGLTGQYAAVDERLTGHENLQHVGRLFHLGVPTARERAGELLERFDLTDAADRQVNTYSGGMRRRLDIAMSLIARPSVLFLDEPTTGLDPRSRNAMWDLIDELVAEGMTTMLTTQYLEEADRLANQIVVIDRGTVIEQGTASELKGRLGGERLEVVLPNRDRITEAVVALKPFGCGDEVVDEKDPIVTVPVESSIGVVADAVRALDAAGIAVDDLLIRRPTLDDVFLTLTGHTAEESEADEEEEVKA
ncbi:daunorubicin/doxorubicin resistance ABC transporter ATP-binding protein DrrA, partial [cyanobacterium TDX16]